MTDIDLRHRAYDAGDPPLAQNGTHSQLSPQEDGDGRNRRAPMWSSRYGATVAGHHSLATLPFGKSGMELGYGCGSPLSRWCGSGLGSR